MGLLQLMALSRLTHLELCGKFKRRLQQHRSGSSLYNLEWDADSQVRWASHWGLGFRVGVKGLGAKGLRG